MSPGKYLAIWLIAGSFLCISCNRETEPRPPNILFCIARQGILFTNAFTPNSKCAPSRACILTGRNTWQLEEACNHIPYFPEKFKVYTEALAENGYFTGMTGKGWVPGNPGSVNGQPRHLAGTPFQEKKIQPPTREISPIDYSGNFADFLASVPEGKAWCFWYGGREPHLAYEYGSGLALGGKNTGEVDRIPDFWPDTEITRNDMLDYAYEIEYFDRHLGEILDQLEQKKIIEERILKPDRSMNDHHSVKSSKRS